MKKGFLSSIAFLTFISLLIAASLEAQQDDKYFVDVHKLEAGSFTYADVAKAHEADLNTQGKHNVNFLTYWVDEDKGYVYCLSKAGDAEHVHATHEEAHGLVPESIYEVVAGEQASYTGNGRLFLDIHELGAGNVTAAAVEEAHQQDLAEQGKHNVNFINYWVDEANGKVFCLSEAPSEEAVIETHKHAHGLVPNTVLTVRQGQ